MKIDRNKPEQVADLYFDDPNSDARQEAEEALRDPSAPTPFGMQR